MNYDAVSALIQREEPLTSPVGIVLSILSLAIMPALAYAKQRTGKQLGSRALVADSKETWICSYLSRPAARRRPLRPGRLVVGRPPSPRSPASRGRLARLGNLTEAREHHNDTDNG